MSMDMLLETYDIFAKTKSKKLVQ